MKELIAWIKKYKVQLILIVCLAIAILGWCKTAQRGIDERRRAQHNIEALTDTVSYYQGKNGELVATKAILEADFNDLKTVNEELQQKIKDMGVLKPQQVVYVETYITNDVHDTIWQIDPDTVINKTFDFSNDWRKLNGTVSLKEQTLGLSIDEDKVFANYYLAIQDGRVYLSSDNPYVMFNEIQGLTVPTPKKKYFSLGVGPTLTYGYDIPNMKPVFVPGISVGVYFNLLQF